MRKERKAIVVYVDLDPVPGTMHTEESAHEVIQGILNQAIPHYNPSVHTASSFLRANAQKQNEEN